MKASGQSSAPVARDRLGHLLRDGRATLILLAAIGIAGEGLAVARVVSGAVLQGVAMHLAATGVVLVALALGTPRRLRPSECAGLVVLLMALPIVGAAALWVVLWPRWKRTIQDAAMMEPSRVLELREDDGRMGGAARGYADGVVLREVLARSTDMGERLAVVRSLRTLADERAVPILKLALNDTSEELRLLAFADLDRREVRIRAVITDCEGRLAASCAPPLQAHLLRRIAEQYWELSYCGFTKGALDHATLRSAAEHAQRSLELKASGTTAFLLARVWLRLREGGQTQNALRIAQRLGVPAATCAPLHAELAFIEGRFDAVGPAFASGPQAQQSPRSASLAIEWSPVLAAETRGPSEASS